MDLMENLSKNIVRLRKLRGMTQDSLGKSIGVSSKMISRWEFGGARPSLEMIVLIAKALNVSLYELVRGVEYQENNYKLKRNIFDFKSNFSLDNKKKYNIGNSIRFINSKVTIINNSSEHYQEISTSCDKYYNDADYIMNTRLGINKKISVVLLISLLINIVLFVLVLKLLGYI